MWLYSHKLELYLSETFPLRYVLALDDDEGCEVLHTVISKSSDDYIHCRISWSRVDIGVGVANR